MKQIGFFLALLVSACSGSKSQPSPYNIPVAAVDTWADFGTGTGRHGPPITKAADGTWSFAFPAKVNGSSVNYVYTKPASLAAGQTITLTFSVDGDATFGNADSNDTGTPSLHLFIWEAGDDLSGQDAFVYYRWWCSSGAVLKAGDNQTISCVVNPANWASVFGENGAHSAAAQSGFAQAVRNVAYIGFTFGAWFFGHGALLFRWPNVTTIVIFISEEENAENPIEECQSEPFLRCYRGREWRARNHYASR